MTVEPSVTVTDRVGDWAGIITRKFTVELAELKRLWPHQRSFPIVFPTDAGMNRYPSPAALCSPRAWGKPICTCR